MTNKKEILEHGLNEILKWVERCNFKRRSVKQGQFIVKANNKVDEIYWSEEARFSIIHMAENGKTLSLGDYHLKNNFFGEIEKSQIKGNFFQKGLSFMETGIEC